MLLFYNNSEDLVNKVQQNCKLKFKIANRDYLNFSVGSKV